MVSVGPRGGKLSHVVAGNALFAPGTVAGTLPAMFPSPTYFPWQDNSL
jgi:hypothetical protein